MAGRRVSGAAPAVRSWRTLLLLLALFVAFVAVPGATARPSLQCCVSVDWTLSFDAATWTVSVTSPRPASASTGTYYVCLNRVFYGGEVDAQGVIKLVGSPGPSPNQCGTQRTSFDLSFVIPSAGRDQLRGKPTLYVQLEFYIAVSGKSGDWYTSPAKGVTLTRSVCCVDAAVDALYDPDTKEAMIWFTRPGRALCAEQADFGAGQRAGRVVSGYHGTWGNCDWTAVVFAADAIARSVDLAGDVYVQLSFRCKGGSAAQPPSDADCRGADFDGFVYSTPVKLRQRRELTSDTVRTVALYDVANQKMSVRWSGATQQWCTRFVEFLTTDGAMTGRGKVDCADATATFTRALDRGLSARVRFECLAEPRTAGCGAAAYRDWILGTPATVCYAVAVVGRTERAARDELRANGCADSQIAVTTRCSASAASTVLEQAVRDFGISLVTAKKCLGQPTQQQPAREKPKPAGKAGARGWDGDYTGVLVWTRHARGKPDVPGRTRVVFSVEAGAISGLRGTVAADGSAQAKFSLKGYDCTLDDGRFRRSGEDVAVTGPFSCKVKGIVSTITGRLEAHRRG